MDFFSSIKTAYDSIGSEISKTFDSSEFEKDSKEIRGEEAVDEQTSTPHKTQIPVDQSSVYATPRGDTASNDQEHPPDDFNTSWGQWDKKITPDRTPPIRPVANETDTKTSLEVGGVKGGASPKVPLATSTPAKGAQGKGKSNLDGLSREDLVKYIKKQAQILHKTKSKCEDLSHECDSLRKQSTTPPSEEVGLVEELQIVRSERDMAVGERKTLKQNVTELTREKQDLADQLTALTEVNSKLKDFCQQQHSKDTEIENLKSSNQTLNDSLTKERERSEKLTSTVSCLRDELEVKERLVSSHEKSAQELKAQTEIFTDRDEEQSRHVDQLKAEIETLRQSYDQGRMSSESTALELEKEREALFSQLTELRNKLDTSEETVCTERQTKESEISSIRAQAKSLKKALEEKASKLQVLADEKERYATSCHKLTSEVSQLHEQFSDLTGQLEAAKNEKKAEHFQAQTDEQHLSTISLDERIASLEAEKTVLTEQIPEFESRLSEQSCVLSSLQEKYGCLERDSVGIRNENESLKKQLSDSSTKVVELESKYQELEHEYEIVKCQLSDMQSKLDTSQLQLETAQKSNTSMESELSTEKSKYQSESESLQVRNETLTSEIETLKQTMDGLRSQNQSLTDSLRQGEEAVDGSTSEIDSLQNDCQRLTRLNQDLECQLEEDRSRMEAEKNDLTGQLEKEKESHREESKKLKAFVLKLKKELGEVREKGTALTQEQAERNKSVCEELEQLKETVESLTREKDEMSKQLVEANGQLESTDQTNNGREDLQREIEELTSLLAASKDRETQAEKSAQLLQSEKNELMSKIASLEESSELVQSEKNELMSKIASLEESSELLQSEKNELMSKIASLEESSELLQSEKNELMSKIASLEESSELVQSELSCVQSDLATANSQANTQLLAIEKFVQEVQALKEDLEKEKQSHTDTRKKLTSAEKEVKSSTLMNLELEDYQRSIRSLEEEIAGRGSKLENVRRESQLHMDQIEKLKKELGTTGQQRQQEQETITKLKQLLVRNKKELAESKKKESEFQESVEELGNLLEREKGEAEQTKVQLSELTATLHSVQHTCDSSVDTLQTSLRNQDLKMASLQSELSSTQASLALVQGDYDNYKVRVHSVLKQKSTGPGQAEISSELKKTYDVEVAKLKAELNNSKSQLSSSLSDHEDLLLEHDQLATRHDQLLQESQQTREKLQLRLKEEELHHSRESREQKELISQLRLEMDEITSAFKTQISGLQQEHKKAVLALREELHSTHSELSRLQEEADSKVLVRAVSQEHSLRGGGVVRGRKGLDLEVRPGGLPSETRSSGVGMDRSELESVSSYPPTPLSREDSSASLERLLSHSVSDVQPDKLSEMELTFHKQLKSSSKKIAHLTELLRESEASSVRLSEQAKLLKEEIRRLERNQEREDVSNMEYLKNVVLKFLHTKEAKEKTVLVPIITKLLQLSPQEVKFVQDAIEGDNDSEGPPGAAVTPQSAQGAANKLTNYIHRWTGY